MMAHRMKIQDNSDYWNFGLKPEHKIKWKPSNILYLSGKKWDTATPYRGNNLEVIVKYESCINQKSIWAKDVRCLLEKANAFLDWMGWNDRK